MKLKTNEQKNESSMLRDVDLCDIGCTLQKSSFREHSRDIVKLLSAKTEVKTAISIMINKRCLFLTFIFLNDQGIFLL